MLACGSLIVQLGTNHWWQVTVHIPQDWDQYERVQFEFDPGCEAMIYSMDGTPLQGITGGFGGDRRVDYIIPPEARARGVHEFVIESSCNGMFGVPWSGDIIAPPDMNRYFRLASADLVVPNQEAWRLLWDWEALKQIISNVPGNTILQNKALTAANEIMNVFDKGDLAAILRARKLADEVFGEGWEEKGADIYKEGPERPTIWGIGHCHIDSAWLWPYRVTQQKVARSWSTQIDLMERYPEHRFACSSAQQYKWLELLYPALFLNVKQKIAEGKFHPIGGSWVENDGNMPSGEALVRQLVAGQRYFETRFGIRCEVGWLPDSFGLTGAYPQIMRKAGMKYFFTQKLSWNNINKFPHSTFNWVGIDGTQVLCHMTPVETYTAQATVHDIKKGLENHKNLESSDTALLVFGNGDGGGGPLSKMLENLRRIRAVTNKHRELPPVDMGHSVDDFFHDLEKTSGEGKRLPNWHGELYLEFHRGTYTSHGSIKKGNRHSEILLRDVELVASLASLYKYHKNSYIYPKKDIDEAWEKVLLNQFHDVLPGSSIGMVYEDAEQLYAEVKRDGEAILEEALSVLFPNSMPLTCNTQSKALAGGAKVVALNTTFFPRLDVVQVPLGSSPGGNGWGWSTPGGSTQSIRSQVHQVSEDGKVGWGIMQCARGGGAIGELVTGSNELRARLKPVSVYTNGSDHFVLRNSTVQLTISEGRITSLLDVQLDRELIQEGQTGGLVIFEDRPNYWDAWDVEIHHLEVKKSLKFSNVSVVAQGPLYAAVRAEVKYGQSTIVLTISLGATTATVRENSRSFFNFEAVVDWRQRHEFLKFELPLNIHSPNATYETQFGHVQRPTHKNTTWDMAKFEVCGHKYADLSEFGYGVAYLSESKYGFSCLGNLLSISLLRAATAPDAEQDQGEHKFSWAVYPHEGHFLESDVPVAGYLYNSPLRVRVVPPGTEDLLSTHRPLFAVDGARNVFLETVKRGEYDSYDAPFTLESADSDSEGDEPAATRTTLVLRLYEAYGGHASGNLLISNRLPVVEAYETNLLEDDQDAVGLRLLSVQSSNNNEDGVKSHSWGKSIPLKFRGFEVKTIKLVLGAPPTPTPRSPKTGEKRSSWVNVDEDRFMDL
ncbi:alpha-mannosidase [Coprinopsis cinerea AmutBmut pab1-1]|nr:alpha-mannosidase [Coprinopsis cinerea AmutBmut pab1-1]